MENRVASVTSLTAYLKRKFDKDEHITDIYLKGEISNLRSVNLSGTNYFSLKDENSIISAVMFGSVSSKLDFVPVEGMSVVVRGRVSIYEARGSYQIYIASMEEDGKGDLLVAFEKLKRKLTDMGVFDERHKKPLPKYPKTIGIVTASTGAAIKDILTTLKRRYPLAKTVVFPTLVQGAKAAEQIAARIKEANEYDLDVLIVGRGGGSIEDLWSFNEEEVVMAIYNSVIPVISAVGHEPDFTLSDSVADVRAATPTAAAEIATVDMFDILVKIDNVKKMITTNMCNRLKFYNDKLTRMKNSYILKNPLKFYDDKQIFIDNIVGRLNMLIKSKLENETNNFKFLLNNNVLKNPSLLYLDKERKLLSIIEKVEVLNPLNTLKRGYSIVKKDGICICDGSMLQKDDKIEIMINNGNVVAKVEKVNLEE